jgi:hypothetical protein
MIGVSVDIQNSHVPNANQKSYKLSQLSGPKVEANLGFKDLGAQQIRAEKVPAISCQTNELISYSIKKNFEDGHEIVYSVCDHVTRRDPLMGTDTRIQH